MNVTNYTVSRIVAAIVFALALQETGHAATVSLPAGGHAALSSAIQGKIAFWLKGDANLVTNASGQVIAWCDAREAAVADEAAYEARSSWTYPRAVTYRSGECPSDYPLAETLAAGPFVDFDEYNVNKWMLIVDAAGARNRVNLTGYAGYLGFGNTAGFIVGDVSNPDIAAYSSGAPSSDRQNGTIYYHKGAGGSGNDNIFSSNNGNGRQGETRVDGRIVNSTTTKHTRNGWEVFLQNGPNISMFVSTLFNSCNFKSAYPVGTTDPTDRQGGGKIAEIMLFSSMLTQDEANEVDAYLRQKWQGGDGAATDVVALGAGDTLAANASSGPIFVGDVAGAGAIEKTGAGTLTIDRNGRLAAGPLALREGKVETIGKRSHHAPLVAIGGKTVSAIASSLTVRNAGDADTFTLNESQEGRRVALAGAEAGVGKVAVTKARLTLQAPALPEATVAAVESPDFLSQGNLIQNGSFEDTAEIIHQGGQWQASITPNKWSLSSLKNTGSGTWGITTTSDTTVWLNYANEGEVADGSKAFYMQVPSATSTNGIKQTFSVAKAGLYEFSACIRVRRRGSKDNSVPLWVLVDDTPVLVRRPWRVGYLDSEQGTFVTDGTKTEMKFKRVAVDVPLSAGEHTLEILATNHSGDSGHSSKTDRALIIDDVRLEPKAEGNFVAVADGSFSSCDFWSETVIASDIGGAITRNSTPFWTFSTSSGFIVRFPTVYFWNPIYNGREDQAIVLQNGNTASQTVTFPKSGRVRVSCRYANRSDNLTGGVRPTGHVFSFSLGESVIASAAVVNTNMTTLVAEGEVSAGAQVLTLASSAVPNKNVDTIVDDIRIEYVEDSPRIVSDTSFADGSTNWTYGAGVVVENDPFGFRELVFTNNVSAELAFTAPSNGTYLLTYQTRGRPLVESGANGVYHNYSWYSHNLDVRLDGTFFANVYGEAADLHPIEIRLPYLTAGEHTLRFSGSSDASVRDTAQSRISDVVVTPLATGAMPDWSRVEFNLSAGAKIDADLPGTMRVKRLRVNGARRYGSFSSSNCDFVTGVGAVEAIPDAFIFVVQ